MAYVDKTTARVIGAEPEIKALLDDRGISGRELARRLGVSQPWVSQRLTGETSITVADLARIVAALGVPLSALIPADDTPAEVTA